MLLSILIVTSFQVYWLKDNYDRERKSLQIKSNVSFQDAVRRLQTEKLKLRDPSFDTSRQDKMKIVLNREEVEPDIQLNGKFSALPGSEMVSTVNAMREKMRDSVKSVRNNSEVIISIKDSSSTHDSARGRILNKNILTSVDGKNKFIRFLWAVDSLQDSLKIAEIQAVYQKKMTTDNVTVPYKIIRLDSVRNDEPDFSNITVGFVHPVTYHLELGNTFPYLMKQIALPILFSIFLVGITLLSFLLLYRNLLRQQRLADLKNDFIGNITHELKTPIATVGVAIEALRSFNAANDPQRTREYLDISANELQRLSLLVDKVLKLSMFEKREVELKKESFDLNELLNEVINIMKLQFEKHQATVSIKTEGDNFTIEADRLHITSVLYNLFDNALKYGKENPVIEIKLSELPRDIIELKIKDNGLGIAKEYQSKIFEKFFRVPMGNEHNIKGYGLGLSYVSEIVQRHMGFIVVESELGNGTTFTIKLPRKEADVIYFDDKRRIIKKTLG